MGLIYQLTATASSDALGFWGAATMEPSFLRLFSGGHAALVELAVDPLGVRQGLVRVNLPQYRRAGIDSNRREVVVECPGYV